MGKLTHKIAPDVKADILRRIKEEGIPVAQAAKDSGLHESTIYNWLGATVKSTPSWSDLARVHKQNKELLALVGELTLRLTNAQKKN